MAERNETDKTSGSVGDVAAMLARGAMERSGMNEDTQRSTRHKETRSQKEIDEDNDYTHNVLEDNSPDEGDDDLDDEVEGGDDDQYSDDKGDDDDTVDTDPDEESEADDDGEPEEEGDEGDDETQEVAYDDDDIVEVTVDGDVQEVSLRDLKAAYSGEGAIEKRLKEATEARKEATQLRDTALQQREEERTRLLQTIQQLDGVIFAPMVEKPDAALRRRDRDAYDEQLDAYEEDQKRIQASRQQMQQFMQEQLQEQQRNRQSYRTEQQQVLVEKAGIKTPKDAKAFQSDVKLAAEHYGFSQDQINAVDNAGVFLMARDAARYIRLQKMKSEGRNSPSKGKKTKTRRKLKPGGPTSKKLDAKRKAQQKQATTERARQSGKVDDVANVLLAGARKRG